MRQILYIFPVLTLLSIQVAAQDPVTLTFSSGAPIDSIRIENMNTGALCILKDIDHIVFSFEDEEIIDTSGNTGTRPFMVTEPIIFPNPCVGSARLKFSSEMQTGVTMDLYDPAGNMIDQKMHRIPRGNHCYNLTFAQPGTHFIKISTPLHSYALPLINLGEVADVSGIAYYGSTGRSEYYNTTSYDRGIFKSTNDPVDSARVLEASMGDLLRFTAYSDTAMEMTYDFLTEDSTYVFTFPGVPAGVYMQMDGAPAIGLDTIYCFATREGYLFSVDTSSAHFFEKEHILTRPITFGGSKRPRYTWVTGNANVWGIDTSTYVSGRLLPVIPKADTSSLTLFDHANGFSREYILIMVPEAFAGDGITLATIRKDNTLDEISGMAASVKNPGCFWVHNDSGDEARIFLINTEGKIVCTVNIDTDFTDNRDWEDIAVGPGAVDGETYIYIGEIGDLGRKYANKFIFRIAEPLVDTGTLNQQLNIARDSVSTIRFDYADGSRDAEILLIDPLTRDLFIITKREDRVQIYELSYPRSYDDDEKLILTRSSVTLPFRLANGGDISADGKEILVKNLTNVYYWKRSADESIQDALSRSPEILPYTKEPQGEAIAWFRDGSAYITVSEKKDGITPVIYKYLRWW